MDRTAPPPGAAIDRFLGEMLDGAAHFAATQPLRRFIVSAGPLRLSLEVAGARYSERLTAGFAHCVEGGTAGLRVIALDGVATGLGPPPGWHFPVTERSHLERLHERPAEGLAARYDPDTRTWRVLSLPRRLAVVWTADAAALPAWEDSAPLRDIIHFASAGDSWLLLHAAGIGRDERGVLLAGPGGAGKSTTTAACVTAGLQSTGDDFLLVDPATRTAHALYDAIKLDDASLARLPAWSRDIANPDRDSSEKARIHLARVRPSALAPSLALQAILLPRIAAASSTTIAPAPPGEAARALIPSTAFLLRGAAGPSLRKAGALLRTLPAFRLGLGPDPAEAAAAIARFLA